jgi:hypothetical protein
MLTEAHSGSDAASMRTTAVLQGNQYVVNDPNIFIANAERGHTFMRLAAPTRRASRDMGSSVRVCWKKNARDCLIGKESDGAGPLAGARRDASLPGGVSPANYEASDFCVDSALLDDWGRRRHHVRVRREKRPEPCRPERPCDDDFKFAVRSKRRVAAAMRQNTRPRVTAMTGGVCPLTTTGAAGGGGTVAVAVGAAAAAGRETLGAFFSRGSSRSLRPLRC